MTNKAFSVPIRAPLAEVERLLKEAGKLGSWDYARDEHFAAYVLDSITNEAEAFDFLEQLIRDSYRARPSNVNGVWSTTCQKVERADEFLLGLNKFWKEHPRLAIAGARRTCCGCHQQGSFAAYSAYSSPGAGRTPKARVKMAYRSAESQLGSDGRYVIHESETWTFLGGGNTPAQAWAAADKALEERVVQRWRDFVNGVNQPEPQMATQTIVMKFPPPRRRW